MKGKRNFSRQKLNEKVIHQDLILAGRVQRSLLPPVARRLNGFEIAGRSASCDEVGGDYFDCLYGSEFPGKNIRVVVGDASGHGINAALLMRSARTFLRTRTMGRQQKPAEIISAMNRYLCLDLGRTGNFMTLFYLDLDVDTGLMSWVRAGHDPAIIYEPMSGMFYELLGEGLPLGVDITYFYNQYRQEKFSSGTIIALATDGVWEARNSSEEPFGKQRLRAVIQKNAEKTAQEITDRLFEELRTFCSGAPIEDDLTLMIVKVTSEQ